MEIPVPLSSKKVTLRQISLAPSLSGRVLWGAGVGHGAHTNDGNRGQFGSSYRTELELTPAWVGTCRLLKPRASSVLVVLSVFIVADFSFHAIVI